jgi:ParB/RepB/Spo0J family partition protein
MSEEKKIVSIDIDELGIDKCNIRRGIWEHDEELINSIKERGIRNPLLVRPIPPTDGKKYGIVCGSRRFNAAIEAGKDKVPCVVEDMTDVEAMMESMIENRQRKGTPTWMDIESIGYIYCHCLNNGLNHADAIRFVYSLTGIGESTIKRYVRIYDLPEEVKGLLREPEDRTIRQKEYLTLFQSRETNRTLSFSNADLLTELQGFSLKSLMEVAVFILNKSSDTAEKIVDFVKIYPDKSIDEIYNEFVEKEYGIYEKVLRFDRETWEALSGACMDRQKYYDDLCMGIIKGWLKANQYLKTRKLKFTTVGISEDRSNIKTFDKVMDELHAADIESYVKVRSRIRNLAQYGYHFVKKMGDTSVYQKPVKNGSGGFYRAFRKGNIIYLRLTSANYTDPKTLLKAEKQRLEKRQIDK